MTQESEKNPSNVCCWGSLAAQTHSIITEMVARVEMTLF